jgi:hypothetical protein
MWDTKRQVIWVAAGLALGSFVIYKDAHDDLGRFEADVFAFWEFILVVIITTMFYFYSRKKR